MERDITEHRRHGEHVRGTAEAMEMATRGLVYVNDVPRYRRERDGEQFVYVRRTRGVSRSRLSSSASRVSPFRRHTRLLDLLSPARHLQATGRDARKRKHTAITRHGGTIRDGAKFGRMVEFGEALPRRCAPASETGPRANRACRATRCSP